MPVYEYECEACARKFEVVASLAEKEKGLRPVCPKCGSKRARQVFGRVSLLTSSKSEDDFGEDFDDKGADDFGAGDEDLGDSDFADSGSDSEDWD